MTNMKTTKRSIAIILTMMMVLTSLPYISFGASNPPKVYIVSSEDMSVERFDDKDGDGEYETLRIELESVKKCTGYRLFAVKEGIEKKAKDYKYKKSLAKTKILEYTINPDKDAVDDKTNSKYEYKYIVRAFNTYKVTKYYNSKTKKWVTKKPASKNWKEKKKKKVTAYRYSLATDSDAIKFSTDYKPESSKDEKDTGDGDAAGGAGGGGAGGGGSGSGGGTPSGKPEVEVDSSKKIEEEALKAAKETAKQEIAEAGEGGSQAVQNIVAKYKGIIDEQTTVANVNAKRDAALTAIEKQKAEEQKEEEQPKEEEQQKNNTGKNGNRSDCETPAK